VPPVILGPHAALNKGRPMDELSTGFDSTKKSLSIYKDNRATI